MTFRRSSSRGHTQGNNGIVPIQSALGDAVKKMGVQRAVTEELAREAFLDAVGYPVAGMCSVVRLDRGALVLATANTALSHQLQMDSELLIAKVNARLGFSAIHRLRFVPGTS